MITVFKRPERTQKAIATVKNQTYKDLEIIVVDGSNSKEIEEIVKSENCIYLPVEPEYVKAPFWIGIQHQRNIGCKAATGEYVAMLDDDDEWDPTKIEKQINTIHPLLQTQVGVVICYSKNIEDFGEFIEKPFRQPVYEDLLKSFNLAPTSTFLINRAILEKVGWWNENLRGMHEYDIALKMTKQGYLIFTIPEVLMYRYRSFNQEGYYYYIKISEVVDFWNLYGKDLISHIGVMGFIYNVAKSLGLISIYLTGYVIKGKVWKLLYPLKELYHQGVVVN